MFRKKRLTGHMWQATAFTVARGSIQENLQIWNFLQPITVNVRAEANLNRDLLHLPLEGTALRYTWPFQSGLRVKWCPPLYYVNNGDPFCP